MTRSFLIYLYPLLCQVVKASVPPGFVGSEWETSDADDSFVTAVQSLDSTRSIPSPTARPRPITADVQFAAIAPVDGGSSTTSAADEASLPDMSVGSGEEAKRDENNNVVNDEDDDNDDITFPKSFLDGDIEEADVCAKSLVTPPTPPVRMRPTPPNRTSSLSAGGIDKNSFVMSTLPVRSPLSAKLMRAEKRGAAAADDNDDESTAKLRSPASMAWKRFGHLVVDLQDNEGELGEWKDTDSSSESVDAKTLGSEGFRRCESEKRKCKSLPRAFMDFFEGNRERYWWDGDMQSESVENGAEDFEMK